MFVYKLALCLCVLGLCSFNQIDAGLREDLSKKKYSFSEPALDEIEAFKVMITQSDKADEVFTLIWEDVSQGNEKIQLKLFQWFSNPNMYSALQNKVPLLRENPELYSLEALINTGLAQEKSWAFYEKALKEKDQKQKYIFLNKAYNYLDVVKHEKLMNSIENDISLMQKNKEFSVPNVKFLKIADIKNENFFLDILKYSELYSNTQELIKLFIRIEKEWKDTKRIVGFSLKVARNLLNKSIDLGSIHAHHLLASHYFNVSDDNKARNIIIKSAEKGDVNSILFLVNSLFLENKNEERLKWLLKGSEAGDPGCMIDAGLSIRENNLYKNDSAMQQKAFYLFQEAVENANPNAVNQEKIISDALFEMGAMFKSGFADHAPNLKEAAQCFLNATKFNSFKAMHYYGDMLREGFEGQAPNKMEGNKWLEKAANNGFVESMMCLGSIATGYDGNQADFDKACEYYLKAASKGAKTAFVPIACLLIRKGNPDLKSAKNWLLKASEDGDCTAIYLLSRLFLSVNNKKNKINKQSYRAFCGWAKKLLCTNFFDELLNADNELKDNVDSNNVNNSALRFFVLSYSPDIKLKAEYLSMVASCYFNGHMDGKRNKKEAFKYALCAAEHNNVDAMDLLGSIYLDGFDDQEPNFNEAYKWFLSAAEKDYAPSMVKLAKLLIQSEDCLNSEDSLKNALFWLEKAKLKGEKTARAYLNMCERLLSDQDEDVSDKELSKITQDDSVKTEIFLDEADLNIKFDFEKSKVIAEEVEDNQIDVVFDKESANFPETEHEDQNSNVLVSSQNYKNPKYIREQLRKLSELKKKQKDQKNDDKDQLDALSKNNQLIVDMLFDKSIKNKNIDYTQLVNLFNDSFFKDQVKVGQTKSGCIIIAKNHKTFDYVAASTHKKHNKTYDGLNPFFARDLLKILQLFGLTQDKI